jgi:hypothetical protein
LTDAVDAGEDISQLMSEDEELRKWISAQQSAYENGKLSESRVQYMNDLPGIDWRS